MDAGLEIGLWFGRILRKRNTGGIGPAGVFWRILLQPRLRILWKAFLHVYPTGILGKWVHRAAAFFGWITPDSTIQPGFCERLETFRGITHRIMRCDGAVSGNGNQPWNQGSLAWCCCFLMSMRGFMIYSCGLLIEYPSLFSNMCSSSGRWALEPSMWTLLSWGLMLGAKSWLAEAGYDQ